MHSAREKCIRGLLVSLLENFQTFYKVSVKTLNKFVSVLLLVLLCFLLIWHVSFATYSEEQDRGIFQLDTIPVYDTFYNSTTHHPKNGFWTVHRTTQKLTVFHKEKENKELMTLYMQGYNGTVWRDGSDLLYKYHSMGGSTLAGWHQIQSYDHRDVHEKMEIRMNTTLYRFMPYLELHHEFKPRADLPTIGYNYSAVLKTTEIQPDYVYIPNIAEPYEYSSPVSQQNVTWSLSTMDDNYIVLYENSTNASLMVLVFNNKPESFTITEEASGNDYFSKFYVGLGVNTGTFTKDVVVDYNYTIISARDHINTENLSTIKTEGERYARMSLAHLDSLSYSISSSENTKYTVNATATFSNLTNSWSLSPSYYVPCLPNSEVASYSFQRNQSQIGTVNYVSGTSASFTLSSNQEWIYSVGWALKQAKLIVDGLKTPYNDGENTGWWDGSVWHSPWGHEQIQYEGITGNTLYYAYTGDSSVLDYIINGTKYYHSQNEDKINSYVMAYQATGNSTYLTWAENSANTKNITDGWEGLYHFEEDVIGLVELYLETGNSTYKNWAQQRIKSITPEVFGCTGDISQTGHYNTAMTYYLQKIGDDISGRNLTDDILGSLNFAYLMRDKYGGQLLSTSTIVDNYPKYCCHQEFNIEPALHYALYLVEHDRNLPRFLYDYILRNFDWIQGTNELGYNLVNSTYAKLDRSFKYDADTDTVTVSYASQLYDQIWWIRCWIYYAQLFSELSLKPSLMPNSNLKLVFADGNRTVDFSNPDPFIKEVTHEITESRYSSNALSFTVAGSTGETSTTKIYCCDKGEPTAVYGADGWSYDSTTKICMITVTHQSAKEVVISWATHDNPCAGAGTQGVPPREVLW